MSPRRLLANSSVAFSPLMAVIPCPIATTTLSFRGRIQRCKSRFTIFGVVSLRSAPEPGSAAIVLPGAANLAAARAGKRRRQPQSSVVEWHGLRTRTP